MESPDIAPDSTPAFKGAMGGLAGILAKVSSPPVENKVVPLPPINLNRSKADEDKSDVSEKQI